MPPKKKLERDYQPRVIERIKELLPEAIVLKNDSSYLQGVPDILVLNKDRWGTLEIKKDGRSSKQPNQEYYVALMNDMSFSAFIYPENEEEVFSALQQSLEPGGTTRVPKR